MDLKSRIEAVLFVTGRAVQLDEIAKILDVEEQEIEDAMLSLIVDYSSRDGALEIDDENGYIIQVKDDYMDIVEKLCPVDISNAVLKTLTVIALKEPIRQSELKELRGSTAYEHVTELVEKGLISRKRDKNGRSYNLKTTPKFAEYFKLKGNSEILSKMETNRLSELLELNKK
ncbi:TPA: SMC-Scp complex subunit ScpB [Candidatus Avigastranaerophilus faecigallinarum]|nr:SMC-Scp complex subunit ScpB [Candidatus Avigastranaerophilus faecigallinarum]